MKSNYLNPRPWTDDSLEDIVFLRNDALSVEGDLNSSLEDIYMSKTHKTNPLTSNTWNTKRNREYSEKRKTQNKKCSKLYREKKKQEWGEYKKWKSDLKSLLDNINNKCCIDCKAILLNCLDKVTTSNSSDTPEDSKEVTLSVVGSNTSKKKQILSNTYFSQSNLSNSITNINRSQKIMFLTTFTIWFVTIVNCLTSGFSVVANVHTYLRSLNTKSISNIFTFYNDDYEISFDELKAKNMEASGIFITLGDFYLLTERKTFFQKSFHFVNIGSWRIIKDYQADYYIKKNCTNCMVKIDNNNFKQVDDERLFFKITFFKNKIWKDSNDSNPNNEEYARTEFNLMNSEFHTVDCIAIGVSKNKMNNSDTKSIKVK